MFQVEVCKPIRAVPVSLGCGRPNRRVAYQAPASRGLSLSLSLSLFLCLSLSPSFSLSLSFSLSVSLSRSLSFFLSLALSLSPYLLRASASKLWSLLQVGMENLVKAVAAERAKLRGWS